MMFFQFFVWGAWFVTLGPFMAARGQAPAMIGNAYTTAPIGAILAPIFLGMVADRFFATQRVLGILHLLGGMLLLAAPSVAPADGAASAWPFIGVLLLHMLCYMPTLGLSNSLAFHNMTNPEKQFPPVRVLGTIGWIVAGFVVGMVASKMTPEGAVGEAASPPHFFYVAGGAGILLGLYSMTLPHTPPPAKGKPFRVADALGLDALRMLKDRNFAVFCVCSFLLCIPLAAYYAFGADYVGRIGFDKEKVPVTMSYGQMSEIGFMLVMPLLFGRLGVKWMLVVGMLAWVIRYGLFGAAWGEAGTDNAKWLVLGGILLHGICYDFFFVTGQIYVDKRCSPEIRGQAQGLLVLLTQGLGMLVGNQVFPRLVTYFTGPTTGEGPGPVDWKMVWFIPAGFAALIMVVFVALFRPARPSVD